MSLSMSSTKVGIRKLLVPFSRKKWEEMGKLQEKNISLRFIVKKLFSKYLKKSNLTWLIRIQHPSIMYSTHQNSLGLPLFPVFGGVRRIAVSAALWKQCTRGSMFNPSCGELQVDVFVNSFPCCYSRIILGKAFRKSLSLRQRWNKVKKLSSEYVFCLFLKIDCKQVTNRKRIWAPFSVPGCHFRHRAWSVPIQHFPRICPSSRYPIVSFFLGVWELRYGFKEIDQLQSDYRFFWFLSQIEPDLSFFNKNWAGRT